MSGRYPARSAIWTAATAIIVLALGACSSATTTSTSASAVASIGPSGHKPTLSPRTVLALPQVRVFARWMSCSCTAVIEM